MATFSNMISVFLCLAFFVSIGSSAPLEDDMETALTNDMNLFSSDLFKEVSHHECKGKNFIMSAMSADMVLALLSLGAEGKTLDEINKGLYLPDSGFTKAVYKPAIDEMNAYKHVTLHLAFKVYVKDGEKYALDPTYELYAAHLFGSEVENINFEDSVAAAAEINSWVEDKTNKTVKGIVEASDFDKYTAVVLINTIYFKGGWENKFNSHYTVSGGFYVSPKKVIHLPMMFQENITKYTESAELDAKMLELNFEGKEMSMVFILPNKVDGLAELEDKLAKDYGKLKAMYDSLKKQTVTVCLPKFNINTTIHLKQDLIDLGMGTMFSDDAQLGGIVVNTIKPMRVDQVIQKAYIGMDEEGVTAGAATLAELVYFDAKIHNALFNADHPFCYGLVNKDKQIVFSGHFTGKE